jgi:alpha-L-rhamnosidase
MKNAKMVSKWQWRESRIVSNHIHLGTKEDRTREFGEWKDACNVVGPKGRIVRRSAPSIDVIRTIKGRAKWLIPGQVQVIDFGENVSGVPNFTFTSVKKGDLIKIVYGEKLKKDGSVNVLTQTAGQIKRGNGGIGSPKVAAQRDSLICGGSSDGTESFTPEFTWHICRYAQVSGCSQLLSPENATFDVIASVVQDTPLAKNFRKGKNDDFVKLHDVCRRTFLANLIGVQSDCPGRERLGYGGDIVSVCDAFALNWDMREFYLKALQDFADEAADDGWITETAPFVGISDRGFGGRAGPISWSLAVPVLMDCLIRHYGDKRCLKYYPVCTRYIKLVDEKHPDGIIPKCIGDHEALERAPNDFTATAHWYEFVRLTAKFADMLGKNDDSKELNELSHKIRSAFIGKWMKKGLAANGTQSAQAIALYLGLVPQEDIPAAERYLIEAVEKKNYTTWTGIFSTRYLLMYLSEHGYLDVAEKLVVNRKFPGWLFMLDSGATTLWETWRESHNIYSNCHPMFGSVDEWLLRFKAK